MIPNSLLCPSDEKHAIDLYVRTGADPGDFLQAVLSNDLRESIGRADESNCYNLPHIVAYCYNNIPTASWGSATNMRLWIERKRLERESLEKPNSNGCNVINCNHDEDHTNGD